MIYTKAILFLALAIATAIAAFLTPVGANRLSLTVVYGLIAIAVRDGVHAAWKQYTTEVAITGRRIVYKTGFVWRRTAEMLIPAVESIFVDQSIMVGRILDYGSIQVVAMASRLSA